MQSGDDVGDLTRRLESLEALTDTGLTNLGVEDLLHELLKRVQETLEADTAAVLLTDSGSRDLVATAAYGIEDEVREGIRVPIGTGFAGRIAALKQPILLDRVDATTVSNPILWEKGIQVMLGVPLLAGSAVIGVLHVGRLDNRPFDAEDTQLLQVAAERLAGATRARQWAVERAAALMLERSLMPDQLPHCPGLEFSARYLTPEARFVGGDWYDLFVLPSGQLWAVTGDVAGHGLEAAVVMGRVRSALRAYALLGEPPENVVELTNGKVCHFEFGSMVTVICATSFPPYDEFRLTAAGHLPPVVAPPGRPAFLTEVPVGPPLGAEADVERSSSTVVLEPGAVMLLYTDGLVERRGELIDVGLERLRGTIEAEQPNAVCRRVLRTLIGDAAPTDDVAMVAIRRN
ncbi:MAG: SpoIIE family protein phosphatase [Acidimicrobiaceae bacterium]|nr:SpoIIE family protein phosphatase [Acidimicrobiaceae bacterium]